MASKHITKDTLIGDLVKQYPQSIEILLDQGLQCVGCHVATWETLEQGSAGHGIDVNKLIKNLNENLKE